MPRSEEEYAQLRLLSIKRPLFLFFSQPCFYCQPSWQAECFSPSQMGLIDQLTWDQHVSLIRQCVWLMVRSWVGCVSMCARLCVCVKRTVNITTEATWGFLWQRVDSLHWTMKCSNLVLLWIDGWWMSTRWGQLWYMGIYSSPWVLLRSSGVSLAKLFWLSLLCLNLHNQSKVLWWSKTTICRASFNGVLMTILEHSLFCLHSRRNSFSHLFSQ